jgi:aminoglycoside phosphotransferase (APT) family kinase protein
MMSADPDGVSVVATWADAEQLTHAPLLVLELLGAHLDRIGVPAGTLLWSRIGEGQSNVTFGLRRGPWCGVLRRGPRPPLPPSTHDMVRVVRQLHAVGLPTAVIIDACEDPDVLGVPFYIMDYLPGWIITDQVPPPLDTVLGRQQVSEATARALAEVHAHDVTTGPLSTIGRPDGFLSRQLTRFTSLWEMNTRRDLPAVGVIGEWLTANMPQTQRPSLVHGDYRIGNIVFESDAPARVQAILDWEMATLGDPLTDVGYLTATYTEADSEWSPLELTTVTRQPGFLTRAQMIECYAQHSTLDLSVLPWYQTLALWRAAIFCEAIYTRWTLGERPDDHEFGPSLREGIPLLLRQAAEFSRIPGVG